MDDELGRLDATGQAEAIRRGEVSPVEAVDAAIARIEKIDPELNAIVTPLFDKARERAASGDLPQGPFRGVPTLLKDLICHSAGDPMYEGMAFLKRLAWVEEEDTYLAAKLRGAGLVFLGKTNAPELGILPTTEPDAFGPTRNPWDTGRSTGGSSGGSAAAVASGMVAVAHANDGGGSIRIPASECGLVGLKPSRARVSLGPDFGDAMSGLPCEHVVTRSVRDTAALLDVTAGPMPGDPYAAPTPARPFASEVGAEVGPLRVGLLAGVPDGTPLHPDCLEAVEAAGHLMEELGHRVELSRPDCLGEPDFTANFITLWSAGCAWDLDYWGRRTGQTVGSDDVEALTWALAEMGRSFSGPAYLGALEWLQSWSRRMARWWEDDGWDLLLTPTIAEPPPALGQFGAAPDNPLSGLLRAASLVPFTPPFNVTGQPAISLPLHWNGDGLPIGIQLAAPYGGEDMLIRVAAQLEEARPWAERRPPVHA